VKNRPRRKLRDATLLQHGAYEPRENLGHLNPPLFLDIAPVQPDVKTAAEVFAESELGFLYFRKGHPNARLLEKRLALIEGGQDALVFSSGLAATNCLLLELAKRSQRIVAQQSLYGGSFAVMAKDLTDAGRSVRFVKNPLDYDEWYKAVDELTKVMWVEMPSNPTIGVVDLERLAKLAKEKGALLIVDNTFAPLIFKPLSWGADIVLRSGSKYENPGNTSGYGIVIGPRAVLNPIRSGRYERLGAPASAFDCWLAELGLRTLELRMRRHSDSAYAISDWLAQRPEVEKVHYPGLPESLYYDLAKKYLPLGCGGILAFELRGNSGKCRRFIEALEIFKHVVSLGDTRSLVTYPTLTTHSKATPEQRTEMGIPDTMIRLSIGLEDPEDLIADLEQALEKI